MSSFRYTIALPTNVEKTVDVTADDRDAADAKVRRDYGATSSSVIMCEESDPEQLDPLDAAQEHDAIEGGAQ